MIADEPVTALDVIVQRQILDQLLDLQRRLGISVILVTHDISVVAHVCDRVVVMYAGQVVEEGPMARVLTAPVHPYTMGLTNAFPDPQGAMGVLTPIGGAPPSLLSPPPRCPFALPVCRDTVPPPGDAACHRAGEAGALRPRAARIETWAAMAEAGA